MATKKRQIFFYADEDVAKWYETLAPGVGTVTINGLIRQHLGLEEKKNDEIAQLEARIKKLEDKKS